MNTILTYIGLLLLYCTHPLHLSFCNLDYNSQKELCTLSVKVFSDDFSENLRQINGITNLSKGDSLYLCDTAYIRSYVSDNLSLRFDSQEYSLMKWKIDSVTNNHEASWIYFSIPYKGNFERIEIRNTLLFDVFSDQKNLLIIGKGKKEKGYQFSRKNFNIEAKL